MFSNLKYSTKKSCLFNHNCLFHSETKQYTMEYWFIVWKYVFLLHLLNKNENSLNAGYWVLSENRKINSQPIRQNKLPQKFRATR